MNIGLIAISYLLRFILDTMRRKCFERLDDSISKVKLEDAWNIDRKIFTMGRFSNIVVKILYSCNLRCILHWICVDISFKSKKDMCSFEKSGSNKIIKVHISSTLNIHGKSKHIRSLRI